MTMPLNAPNVLTFSRLALIPVLVIVYYAGGHMFASAIFILAGITDWLDGYLARRLDQQSRFGAFLDPVADKLIVTIALVLLVSDPVVLESVYSRILFTVVTLIIIGRELIVSALREWMAEVGRRASVAVNVVGKFKTTAQIVAIAMLLFRNDVAGIPIFKIGESLFYVAGALTLWSMLMYLRAARESLLQE
jgi:CDP-diacylglycerol--glycerol-3-phosphate 3-phosphatidyltransferase